MSEWLNIYRILLPRADAWCLKLGSAIRDLFEGLSQAPDDVRGLMDRVFREIDPQHTTSLVAFEGQFALQNAQALNEQERRDRLAATWRANGGQDPAYIQETLQGAGFPVFVHEWWEPGARNGSVNGDFEPVARCPTDFIIDDINPSDLDPATAGYLLVNKLTTISTGSIGVDHEDMYVGGAELAYVGNREFNIINQAYGIPPGDEFKPYFLYIGGETFPEVVQIPADRRDEFEDLCLKICPTEQWLGIIVQYI